MNRCRTNTLMYRLGFDAASFYHFENGKRTCLLEPFFCFLFVYISIRWYISISEFVFFPGKFFISQRRQTNETHLVRKVSVSPSITTTKPGIPVQLFVANSIFFSFYFVHL